jgi:hypothetical protein
MITLRRFSIAAVLLSFLLTGCGTTEELPQTSPSSYVRLSPVAPPEPFYEEKPRASNPMREIWRPGYWKLEDAKFNWIPGQMMPKPSPTADWSSDHWEEREYGWAFIQGYWQ